MAEFRDQVKHINGEVTGIVIAEYTIREELYFDVRTDDNHIIYATPASNWITTIPVDE